MEKRIVNVHYVRPMTDEEQKKYEEEKKRQKRKTVKKKKKKKKHHFLRNIFTVIMCLFIILASCAAVYIAANLHNVPTLDLSKRKEYSQASEIYDSNGTLLMKYGSNENVTWVNFDEVPKYLVDAFVSIEDQRFYEHKGVDLKRTAGAVWGQISHTADYGGSTITQQLVKNVYLTKDRTYKRKIQEMFLALKLEQKLSKNEILEWYMNTAFMGGSVYGIYNAAKNYFGKDLSELTLRECAAMAGVVQSPNKYSPRVCYQNGDMTPCNNRTDTVLYTLHNLGKITDAEYEEALNEQWNISAEEYEVPGSTFDETYYKNAYFIDYAIKQAAVELAEQDDPDVEITDDVIAEYKNKIKNGGYKITLSLDENIQKIVQDTLEAYKGYPRTRSGAPVEASAVVEDQHTGRLVAIIGGRHEATEVGGFNRAVDSTQGVGSAIKPLSVYGPAIELGDYPGTTVMDNHDKIEGYDTEQGYPGGETINGPITMRRALELSHNVPAVKFLLDDVGISKAKEYLINLGFDQKHLPDTASGLGLGAADVTTLEMTGGYAALANGGVYIEPHAFTEIRDRNGDIVLDESVFDQHRVFSAQTVWLVTDMMETNMDEGLGVKAKLATVKSAAKTGTNEHKVISIGGYTPYYTSYVRVSLDDYSDMVNSSSYLQASPLWKSYMDKIHSADDTTGKIFDKNKEIQDNDAEDLGIQKYYVCKNSGLLATDKCKAAGYAYMEYATEDNAPKTYCSKHVYAGDDGGSANGEWGDTYSDPANDIGWWDETGAFHKQGNGWWDGNGVWHGTGWWDEKGYHPN